MFSLDQEVAKNVGAMSMLILKDPGAESGVRPRCLNGHPFQFFNSMTEKLTKCIINLLCLVLTLMKFV